MFSIPNLIWRVRFCTLCFPYTEPCPCECLNAQCDFHESTSAKCRQRHHVLFQGNARGLGFNFVILQEQTCLEWLCILRDLLDCNVVFQTVCVLLSLNVGTPGMAARALLASWIESGEGCGVVVEKTVRYLQQNTTAPARHVSPSPSPQHLRHHSSRRFSGNFERRGEQGFSCDKLALLRPVSCNVLGRMMRNAYSSNTLAKHLSHQYTNYFCGSKQWFSHYVQDAPNEERIFKTLSRDGAAKNCPQPPSLQNTVLIMLQPLHQTLR